MDDRLQSVTYESNMNPSIRPQTRGSPSNFITNDSHKLSIASGATTCPDVSHTNDQWKAY